MSLAMGGTVSFHALIDGSGSGAVQPGSGANSSTAVPHTSREYQTGPPVLRDMVDALCLLVRDAASRHIETYAGAENPVERTRAGQRTTRKMQSTKEQHSGVIKLEGL